MPAYWKGKQTAGRIKGGGVGRGGEGTHAHFVEGYYL